MDHLPGTADTPALTVAEAVTILSPPMKRRTLERHVARRLTPVGQRRQARGRPARTYDMRHLYALHAAWVRRELDDLQIVTQTRA